MNWAWSHCQKRPLWPHKFGKRQRNGRTICRRNPQNLVGREEELAQLSAQLANPAQRLHTLVGPGGIGKTSLALAVGWQAATAHLGPFLHGVFFVPLADVALVDSADFNPLVTAVAEAIGFTFAGSREPQAQLMAT